MKVVFIISIIIVFVVLILSVLTTSKAYQYKHTVDPVNKPKEKSNELDSSDDERLEQQDKE